MKNNNPRKAIHERLENGESKQAVYTHLKENCNATGSSARVIAQWSDPAEREKNKALNRILLVILLIITAVVVIPFWFSVWQGFPKSIGVIVAVPLMSSFVIYQVARFNGAGYTFTVLYGIIGVFRVWVDSPETPLIEHIRTNSAFSALLLGAVILAEILRRRLVPNSTFFMRPKKDKNGDYIF